jgi:peptidoglycan/LPS O-acetylase OafA/YrhL
MTTLGDALAGGRSANLDALRVLLAASVIVSHAWPLALGPGTPEPLHAFTGHALGGWAVLMFFFLSGLLVTASAERREPGAFWAARARRIVPGLGAALLVTLALAIASGAAPAAGEAIVWFARAITLVSIEHRLTGAFAGNPYPAVVNGPLWSLFHEVAAYALCLALVRSPLVRRRLLPAVAVLILLAAAVGDSLPGRLGTFAPLCLAFALGMAAHLLRDRLPLSPGAALVLMPLALVLPPAMATAAVAYALLTLALRLPALPVRADLSYGLYIYGWPVAQMIVHHLPGIGPLQLAVLSLAATLPLAAASWHLVERPMLARRRAAA